MTDSMSLLMFETFLIFLHFSETIAVEVKQIRSKQRYNHVCLSVEKLYSLIFPLHIYDKDNLKYKINAEILTEIFNIC
jgi:hypothetical protein